MKEIESWQTAVFVSNDATENATARRHIPEIQIVSPDAIRLDGLTWSIPPNAPARVCGDCGCVVGSKHGYVQLHRRELGRIQMALLCTAHYRERLP